MEVRLRYLLALAVSSLAVAAAPTPAPAKEKAAVDLPATITPVPADDVACQGGDFFTVLNGKTCEIQSAAGSSFGRFDTVRVVRSVYKETGPVTGERVPLMLVRRGTAWHFAAGTEIGPAFTDVRRYEHVVGVTYWLAKGAGGRDFIVSAEPFGWRVLRVSKMIEREGTWLVIATEAPDAVYVYWGESIMGPYASVKDFRFRGDGVAFLARGAEGADYRRQAIGMAD